MPPPRRMRVAPITIESRPRGFFGTPADVRRQRQRGRQHQHEGEGDLSLHAIGRINVPAYAGNCAVDQSPPPALKSAMHRQLRVTLSYPSPARRLVRRHRASSAPASFFRASARSPISTTGYRRHLGSAHENPRRRLHLVPLIGAVRSAAAAFARCADDAAQRGREGRDIGIQMAERDQRQRRIEGVHLGGDQLGLDIAEHARPYEVERAVRIDRGLRCRRQRDEGGVAAAEIGAVQLRQIVDVRARLAKALALRGSFFLEADDALDRGVAATASPEPSSAPGFLVASPRGCRD